MANTLLIPTSENRHDAITELRGESLELEAKLRPITLELNSYPLRINRETWLRNLEREEEAAAFHREYCQHLAKDDDFRPNSPADCRRVLNTNDTSADALLELAHHGNLLAGAIRDARSVISRLSQLRAWGCYAGMGFVQPLWDSLGSPHARYTSESPILNNRIDAIRATIEPQPGWSFLSMDLSAAEYVTWASLSKDETLSQAFRNGCDFHTAMAEGVKSLVPNWCPDDLRAAGKTLNFATLYQMLPFALSRKLGCSQETAGKIIDSYYQRAPRAAAYIADYLARCEYFGYSATFFGRRRYCPEYQEPTGAKETHQLEKTLWHFHISGTSAEVCKLKQLRVWEGLRRANFKTNHVRLAVQQYDECLWACRDDVLSEAQPLMEELWNTPEEGFLPFRSAVKLGKTWEETQ